MLTYQRPLTEKKSLLADTTCKRLAQYIQENRQLVVSVSDQQQAIELPSEVAPLLLNILEAMAAGQGVTIFRENAELTTVQAAEILNVSRPFLIKLLENGAIPYHMVGTHRRLRIEDVISYKETIDRARREVLDQLVEEAQKLDMGY